MEFLIVYNCHILIAGDVNIHLDKPDDRLTRKFNHILEDFGLAQHISCPTHNAGHTLDVIITKVDPKLLVETKVHPPTFSDHSLLVAKLPLVKPKPTAFNATVRSWKKLDRDAFRRDLLSSPLCSSESLPSSAEDLADLYHETLSGLIDKHAPRRMMRKHYRPITPWYNDACQARKRKVRLFERKYRRSKSAVDRESWLAQLRSSQDFYRQVQDSYWQTLVSESSGNAKKLWNTISAVMGKKQRLCRARRAHCGDVHGRVHQQGS